MRYLDDEVPRSAARLTMAGAMVAIGGFCYLIGLSNSPSAELRDACTAAVASFDAWKDDAALAVSELEFLHEQSRRLVGAALTIEEQRED